MARQDIVRFIAAVAMAASAIMACAATAGAETSTNFVNRQSYDGIVKPQGYDHGVTRPASSLWRLITNARDENSTDSGVQESVITPAASTIAVPAKSSTKALSSSDQASADVPDSSSADDPLEPFNRLLFGVNEAIDLVVLRPVSFVYRTIVPTPLRRGIANVVANAYAPVTFANDLLQGDPEAAKVTLVRFMVNSTAGFAGMVDAAAAAGLNRRDEDFGQTMGVWGAGPGPYLVVPVVGPTTVRDGVGRIVDIALNPLTWILWYQPTEVQLSPYMASVVTTHESIMDDLQALRERSPDFYASLRDIYLQKRASDIANGVAAQGVLEPINSQGVLEPINSQGALEPINPE